MNDEQTETDTETDAGTDAGSDSGDGSGSTGGGGSSPGSIPDADEIDTERLEKERAERLDPENRPDNVAIDNSDRTFDSAAGMFTDNDDYEDAEKQYVGEEDLSEDSEATEEVDAEADDQSDSGSDTD